RAPAPAGGDVGDFHKFAGHRAIGPGGGRRPRRKRLARKQRRRAPARRGHQRHGDRGDGRRVPSRDAAPDRRLGGFRRLRVAGGRSRFRKVVIRGDRLGRFLIRGGGLLPGRGIRDPGIGGIIPEIGGRDSGRIVFLQRPFVGRFRVP